MKLLFLAAASLTILGGGAFHYSQANTPVYAVQDLRPAIIERKIEMVYLPNNTCRIETHDERTIDATIYKEYVKACLNNRNLRTIIE